MRYMPNYRNQVHDQLSLAQINYRYFLKMATVIEERPL